MGRQKYLKNAVLHHIGEGAGLTMNRLGRIMDDGLCFKG